MKSCRMFSFLYICALVVCFAAPAYGSTITDYVIFSQTKVQIGPESVITGLVGANFKTDDNAQLNTEVNLNGNARVIGNVQSGDDVRIGTNGAITGTITLPLSGGNPLNPGGAGTLTNAGTYGAVIDAMPSLPSLPSATAFSSGGTNYQFGSNNQTLSLAPGSWGTVDFAGSSTLNLSSGNYYFDALSSGNNLTLNLNLTGGPIRIYVTGYAQFGSVNMVLAGGTASDVYIETHYAGLNAFLGGGNSHVFGDVFTPNGTIHIGSGSSADASFYGHLWGYDVDIEHGVSGSAPAPVPIPAAAWLLGSGLLGLVALRRRLKK